MSRKTFDRTEFIRTLSEKLNITKTSARQVHDAFIETLKDGLQTGRPVILGDVGRVYLVKHKASTRYNINTKEIQDIAPKLHGRISISERFRKEASAWPIY